MLENTDMEYHDYIHDALHKGARIDYTKPIVRNASAAVLYEHALKSEKGTAVSSTGALVADSGSKKGRCPKDKRVVDEPSSSGDIWVTLINIVGTC
jgi:phosphoenolpyruvate carboxykinase (ATP)